MSIKNIFIALSLIIITLGCSEDSLDNHRVTGEKPTIADVVFDKQTGLSYKVTGKIVADGGLKINEVGMIICPVDSGEPNLDNPKASTIKFKYQGGTTFEDYVTLLPASKFNAAVYAVNIAGVVYSDIVGFDTNVDNPESPIELSELIAGKYQVGQHYSLMYSQLNPKYDVNISHIRGNIFVIDSLQLFMNGSSYKMRIEIEINQKNEGDSVVYELVVPYQTTGLKYIDNDLRTWNISILNTRWGLYSEDNLDILGKVTIKNGVELSITTGYMFYSSHPLTNDLQEYGSSFDAIVAPDTYNYPANEEDEDTYKSRRYPCLLTKKL